MFAKGTTEPGAFGMLVGPLLTTGLGFGWSSVGVSYDADIPGDFCLGLPGGMVTRDMINQAAVKCPSSNIFLSGYSQGAMVVRNGLAYADEAAKSHVKVSFHSEPTFLTVTGNRYIWRPVQRITSQGLEWPNQDILQLW
jgi:Cutinase